MPHRFLTTASFAAIIFCAATHADAINHGQRDRHDRHDKYSTKSKFEDRKSEKDDEHCEIQPDGRGGWKVTRKKSGNGEWEKDHDEWSPRFGAGETDFLIDISNGFWRSPNAFVCDPDTLRRLCKDNDDQWLPDGLNGSFDHNFASKMHSWNRDDDRDCGPGRRPHEPNAVPEPLTASLSVLAVGGILYATRRRRSA